MIAWRKETRDGSVPVPLCNFTAQIVAEEVIDDGAERRTILGIEGTMPDGRRLPCARIPAERFNGHELGDRSRGARRRSSSPGRGRRTICAPPSRC